MNIISRLTQKHLWSNKRRTWVTIIGVMLCTAMICAVYTLVSSFRHFLIECEIYDNGSYHASFSALPYSQVSKLEANAEINATGLVRNRGAAQNLNIQNPDKPYLQVNECDAAALSILPVHLVEGRLPQTPNEILLPQHLQESGGVSLSVGQTITLDLGERSLNGAALSLNKQYQEGETLVHTQKKTYTVVGIMERMGSESYSSACYTALSFLQPATLSPGASVTAYMQLAHPSKTHETIPSIAEQIGITDENINYNRFLLAYYGSFDDYNLSNMFSGLGIILIALIMVGSVSVIYNAFAISAMERKKQFGLLASIGATQKQIRKSVWQEGLTVGLIGIPLGIIAGILGIAVTLSVVQSLIKDMLTRTSATLSLYVSPPLILLSVLIAGVTIALSVFIPARRAAKTPPVEAIRATQEIKANGKVRTNRLTQRIFGFEANLAKKQMQRNRKRYRTTIFSLFMSLVMFLSFSSFVHYMKTGLDMQFQGGDYDYSINGPTNQDNQTPHLDEVYNQLKSNPYVSQCAERSSLSLSMKLDDSLFSSSFLSELRTQGVGLIEKTEELDFEQLPLSVYALSDEEYDTLLSQHHLSSPDRSGLILVDQFQYKSEDGVKHLLSGVNKSALPKEITLVGFEEIENTREEEFDVVPYETKPVFVSAQLIGTVSELPYAVFPPSTSLVFLCSKTQYQTLHKAFPSDESMGRTLFVSVANEQYEAFDAWRQQNPLLNDHSSLYVYSVHEVIEANRRVLIVLSIFCYGFITLMTLISITSVLNTISTNMQLRKKEFAMLQSVGMTQKSMRRMIRFESLFYGMKALLFALPVSLGISYYMYRMFAKQYQFAFTLPWTQYLGAILGVFLIVFATMQYATRKMRKQNIVETIRQDSI